MKGRIDFYMVTKGFGFIKVEGRENERDMFFHVSNVVAGIPATGREVIFEEGATSRGPVALSVCVIMPDAAREAAVRGFTESAGIKAGA